MVRSLHEARDLILRGGVDVVQPDVVLAGGLGGCRRIAALADLCGRMFSPHTWSNGLGLLANLHLALAVSTCPFIEVPHDPPGWSPERRDWLLGGPVIEIARGRDDRAAARPRPRRDARSRGARGAPGRDEDARRRPALLRHAAGGAARSSWSRRARARCSCAWPRPASATPTCTSPTATSGTGAIRSCSGTRAPAIVEAVGEGVSHVAPGDPVAFCFVPACGECRALRGGPAQPLRGGRRGGLGGHAARRQLAPAARRRDGRCSTSTSSPASPSTASSPPAARCRSRPPAALAGVAARLRRRHGRRRRAQRGAASAWGRRSA